MLELQASMSTAQRNININNNSNASNAPMVEAFRHIVPEEGVEINYNEFIAAAMCR